jgi:hypothetical protein
MLKKLFYYALLALLLLAQPYFGYAQVLINEGVDANPPQIVVECAVKLQNANHYYVAYWKEKIEKVVQEILKLRPSLYLGNMRQLQLLRMQQQFQPRNVEPHWRDVARAVHEILGDHAYMARFIHKLLFDILEESIAIEGTLNLYHLSLAAKDRVIERLARESGWDKPVWFRYQQSSDFCEMLSEGHLFRDLGIPEQRHTVDGHLLQILAVAPEIDRRFGPNTMKKFLKYIGKYRRKALWDNLFDLGPPHFNNFHSPAAFYDFGLVHFFENQDKGNGANDSFWIKTKF